MEMIILSNNWNGNTSPNDGTPAGTTELLFLGSEDRNNNAPRVSTYGEACVTAQLTFGDGSELMFDLE